MSDLPPPPAPPPPKQPGWVPPGYVPQPPRHPQADTVLALGLVGLIGGFLCYLPILVSPFAWVMGNRVRREIRESGGRFSGQDAVDTGRILGIVGTVLLVLGLVALVGLFGLFAWLESEHGGWPDETFSA